MTHTSETLTLTIADTGVIIDALRMWTRFHGAQHPTIIADSLQYIGDLCRLCGTHKKQLGGVPHRCWDPSSVEFKSERVDRTPSGAQTVKPGL